MATRVEKSQRLFEVAESQQGYFTSADAKRLGYGYPSQHFHVKQGNWIRIDRGIYRLKKFPAAIHEDLMRWWLWSRKKGVISYETAAAVYELGDLLPSKVHLTVPPNFRRKPAKGLVLHKADVDESETEKLHGFPITTARRTIADLEQAQLDPERLSAVVKDALKKGLVDRKALNQVSASADRPAGSPDRTSKTEPRITTLLNELKAGLKTIYGNRLKGVYLFGSYARGDQDKESDLDILVVLHDFENYAQEVNRTGQLAADLSLQYGITISAVFIREHDWLHGETPFLSNVREEALAA